MNSNSPALLALLLSFAALGFPTFAADVPRPPSSPSGRALQLAQAQPHRATHLGNPRTRFADPLVRPSDLRARFRDETLKPDVAVILEQWGWTGDLNDLHYAALTAEITEVELPRGTRMPFMSSRKDGKPVCLKDVIWDGPQPAPAYVFYFSSNGRKYKCVTPKACSNFYLEDLGPEVSRLELTKVMPAEANLCDPIDVLLVARNTGRVTLNRVQVSDLLPPGLFVAEQPSTVTFDAGTLRPGESREFRFQARANQAGLFDNPARVTSAEGVGAEATASTLVRAPALELVCAAPAQVYLGQPAQICVTLRNVGDAPESRATVTLPIPADSRLISATDGASISPTAVSWELADIRPNASLQLCATFSAGDPGALAVTAFAQGACAPRVESDCGVRVSGVPAILVELVDLQDPIEVGSTITYEIRVLNQGSIPGTNLQLICTIPDSQEFLSASGITDSRLTGKTLLLDPLPVLEPKAQATWQVVTKALQPDDSRFLVEVITDQFERPILEVESTHLY